MTDVTDVYEIEAQPASVRLRISIPQGTGLPVTVENMTRVRLAVSAIESSGRRATPSMTVTVEESSDGESWSTVHAFSLSREQTSGEGTFDATGPYLRASWEASGTWGQPNVNAFPFAGATESLGGSSSAVGCVLQFGQGQSIDIHDVASYPLNWDALFSDIFNESPLGALPDGIGLTASFDGTSNVITMTETGIWSFSFSVQLSAEDETWEGWLDYSGDISYQEYPLLPEYRTSTQVLPLAAGAVLEPRLRTIQAATADPFALGVVYLSLCRLG